MGQLLHRNIRQCGELLEIIQIIIQVIIQVILTTCFSLSRGAQGGSGVSSRPVVGSSLSCALNAVVLWPNWHRKPPRISAGSFTLASFPQLRHNIQRAGAHDSGRKHTRGPEVVQQQPRPRNAYELARVRGTAPSLDTRPPSLCGFRPL